MGRPHAPPHLQWKTFNHTSWNGGLFQKGNKGSTAQLSIVKGPFHVFVEQKKQPIAYAKQEINMYGFFHL